VHSQTKDAGANRKEDDQEQEHTFHNDKRLCGDVGDVQLNEGKQLGGREERRAREIESERERERERQSEQTEEETLRKTR
jgi:hypothetical protein